MPNDRGQIAGLGRKHQKKCKKHNLNKNSVVRGWETMAAFAKSIVTGNVRLLFLNMCEGNRLNDVRRSRCVIPRAQALTEI
jgi:hypothetical protein